MRGTYSTEVSVMAVKVVCAKAPFLTVTVIVPKRRLVIFETDHSVKTYVDVVGMDTRVQALEADDVADQYEFHCSQQSPVKLSVRFSDIICEVFAGLIDALEVIVESLFLTAVEGFAVYDISVARVMSRPAAM